MNRLDLIAGILLEVLECNADAIAKEAEEEADSNVPSAAASATRVRHMPPQRAERRRRTA